MRIRALEIADATDLGVIGTSDEAPSAGLVFVARRGLQSWNDAEDELAEAFDLVKAASSEAAPVVFVVDSDAMLGRAEPLDSMVATGLVAGARALALEGLRTGRYVGIISTDRSEAAGSLSDAVEFAVTHRLGLGQILTLGSAHTGGMFP